MTRICVVCVCSSFIWRRTVGANFNLRWILEIVVGWLCKLERYVKDDSFYKSKLHILRSVEDVVGSRSYVSPEYVYNEGFAYGSSGV